MKDVCDKKMVEAILDLRMQKALEELKKEAHRYRKMDIFGNSFAKHFEKIDKKRNNKENKQNKKGKKISKNKD